jgi:hypothetical protein
MRHGLSLAAGAIGNVYGFADDYGEAEKFSYASARESAGGEFCDCF